MILVNGALVEGNKAEFDFSDRGLMLGDGLTELLPVLGGEIPLLDAHLDRLERGLAVLGFSVGRGRLEADIAKAMTRATGGYGLMRLIVTRGGGSRGLLPPIGPKPTVIVTMASYSAAMVFEPTTLATSSVRRNEHSPISRLKSIACLDCVLALREAGEHGARDALLLNTAGKVVCSTVANVFALFGGKLATPPLADGVVDGVTRGFVMAHAGEMGLTVAERSLELDELKSADAVFLTSSSRFIQPVARIDATTYDYDLRSKIEVSSSLGELLGLYTAPV